MCKRSVKHMADATTWGRLGRIVMRPRSARRSEHVSGIFWRKQSRAGKHCLEREQFAAMTATEAKSAAGPERRPGWGERLHQASTLRSEQLYGALSRRKASGVSGRLTNASFV
jgi:hypothetical protein